MTSKRFVPVAVLFASLLPMSAGFGQEAQVQPDAAELQKLREQLGKPGKEHQQLRRLVGTWRAEVKYFFDESNKPTVSEASATFRSLMGGRYVQQNFNGEIQGQKFSGMGISGYDNTKKKYVGIWIDNMGTGIMHTEGTYDVKTNSLTEIGISSSPVGDTKFKSVSHYLSDDKFTFTMHVVSPEGDRKMMEITYTRVEKPTRKKKEQ